MKQRNFLLSALVVLFCALPLAAQKRDLSWSMALLNSKNQGVSFVQPVSMQNGEVFSLVISGQGACYVYVVAQDSDRKVAVLHSGLVKGEEPVVIGPLQVTPPGGEETLYVVVSLKEQAKLQEAVDAYNNSDSTRNSRSILSAVLDIRRSVSQLRENPEKPVYMGGAFRGTDAKIQGAEYSGLEAYVKTVRIKH